MYAAAAVGAVWLMLVTERPQKLYPTDDTEMLSDQMPADFFLAEAGFDDLKFLSELEDLTGLEVNLHENLPRFVPGRFFWLKYPKSENLGAWVTETIGVIRRAVASQDQIRAC